MRILAIRGKNLASIEGEFEIDFRKEPLCSTGIFAITGPTGAGKSTILDAMCIALYSTTPRLKNIKNSKVLEGSGNNAVREDHIETILRRGKSDGYAEVDFRALDSNEYRVRWSISRRRNSPTGSFRDAIYDLTNLNTDEHTSLSKTEHKEKIQQLIGLSFEQFTRAVLLAQGNFAAFLKADENDKATILQTLTGTEIYKRISEIIYRRNDEARKELALIEEKKRSLAILSDEECASLNERKEILLKRQETASKELQILITKKNWLDQSAQLLSLQNESDIQLATARKELEDAAPRIENLKRIDSVQDIRDQYTSLCNSVSFCKNAIEEISSIKKMLEAQEKELAKAKENAVATITRQDEINKEWLNIQPQITQAIKLEEQQESESKRGKDIRNELECIQKEYNDNNTKVNNTITCINTLKKELYDIQDWFSVNRCYQTVIPYIPSIIENITSAQNETTFADNKTKQLINAEALLKTNIRRLDSNVKQKEELEQTLSSEIASLREKLVEGVPCPVCGSRHHEIMHRALNILEEKELDKKKKEVKQQIEYLEKAIEDGKTEITGLRTAIELHRSSAENSHKRCLEYLQAIENPKELLQKTDICIVLNKIRTDWEKNKEKGSKITEELAIQQKTLELLEKQNEELIKEKDSKNKQLSETKLRIEKIRAEIESILGKNNSTKALQEYYNTQITKANKDVATAMEKKTAIAEICNKLNGQLSEKNTSLENERKRNIQLQETIDSYLIRRKDGLSFQQLKEILSIDQAVISKLRKEVEQLTNAVTTAIATKKERVRNIEEHNKATIKPEENEDSIFLQSAIDKITEENREVIEQLTTINATLFTNQENCKKFAEYKEECDKKQEFAELIGILNTAFGSAYGDKLTKLVQGYTLDILLNVANIHLKEITGRYELARISDNSLGIKIIDLDMLSESRSVHSLSGGETFLVSLALSLALSSISSNRMSIESLFIDEGFGALDSNTLRIVMSALERVQSQGRIIGVISHYSEMLEQIPVKIAVIKQNSGRSKIEIKED